MSDFEDEPLPKYWSEHISPSGHVFYHHALTGESTYARPGVAFHVPQGSKIDPITGKLIKPEAAPKAIPIKERPASKEHIEGTTWIRVVTNHNNVFFFDKETKSSTWLVPEELAPIEEARKLIEHESLKRKAEEEAAAAESTKKPKRKKAKVIHSLADIEDPELKKSVLDQLAEEVQRVEEIKVVPAEPELTSEEARAAYKAMLAEKDINPMHPWDMELPKFAGDPRYLAVKQLKERRALFDEFCKEKIREQRMKKQAAPTEKQDPAVAYKDLLRTHVTSTRTHWEDFRTKHKKDQRFREFGRDDREREKAFRAWLKELGELKRADAKKAEELFRSMLKDFSDEKTPDQSWTEFKPKVSKDPRYEAVKSSSQRAELFEAFKATLTAPKPVDAAQEAKARKEKALAARQQQVGKQMQELEKRASASRFGASKEEAEREFKSLLIDAITSQHATWEECQATLQRDGRYNLPGLSEPTRRRIFQDHISELTSKRLDSLEHLFERHATKLETPFAAVWAKISDEPSVKKQGSEDQIRHLYEVWQRKWKQRAQEDFMALLKENSFVDFWGRTRAEGDKGEARKGFEDAGDEELAVADAVDVRQMSQAVDLAQINAVLKHDKRFQLLESMAEQRDAWTREYLSGLQAHAMSVHTARSGLK